MESLYQEFIYKSRYSRYLPEQNRRENWEETINRYLDFMENHLKDKYSYDMKPIRGRIFDHIHDMKVMPSMRALMTSGKEEGLKQYNEIMECERHYHETEGSSGHE